MNSGWLTFSIIINFLEMLTSCLFAARLFQRPLREKREWNFLLMFAVCGTTLLTIKELGIFPIPDYVPALLIFTLYALTVCHVKWWNSILWALLNYLLIGIMMITMMSVTSIALQLPIEQLSTHQTNGWVMVCVIVRLSQIILSEIILIIMKHFKRPHPISRQDLSLVSVSIISILVLMGLWNLEFHMTEELILYFNIFICLLVLVWNFGLLLFQEILSNEKADNKELLEHNHIMSMQIQNQNELNELYNAMRGLKHDMNSHLHIVSGYMQMKEYQKAEEYLQIIIGEVNRIESYQTGNPALDALFGTKTAIARKDGIRVQLDVEIPESLNIAINHLAIIIGNLYDNAIEANRMLFPKDMRYINIRIFYNSNSIIMDFENATVGKDKRNNDRWKTTKKTVHEHGYGLRNIDQIVKLYDGYCYREIKNNVFSCQIRLPDIHA